MFDPNTEGYTLTMPGSVLSLSFFATTTDAAAAIEAWSPADNVAFVLPLPATTTFTVTVRAQDGTTTKTYTIDVTRPRNTDNFLASLDLPGSYGWTFDAVTSVFSVRVPNSKSSATAVATTADPTATVSCTT